MRVAEDCDRPLAGSAREETFHRPRPSLVGGGRVTGSSHGDLHVVEQTLKNGRERLGHPLSIESSIASPRSRTRAKLCKRNWITVHCENAKFAESVRFIGRSLMDTTERLSSCGQPKKSPMIFVRSLREAHRFRLISIARARCTACL